MKMLLGISIAVFLFVSLIISSVKLKKMVKSPFLLMIIYLGSGSVFAILSHHINSEKIQLVLSWGFPVVIGSVMLMVAYCVNDTKRKK